VHEGAGFEEALGGGADEGGVCGGEDTVEGDEAVAEKALDGGEPCSDISLSRRGLLFPHWPPASWIRRGAEFILGSRRSSRWHCRRS